MALFIFPLLLIFWIAHLSRLPIYSRHVFVKSAMGISDHDKNSFWYYVVCNCRHSK